MKRLAYGLPAEKSFYTHNLIINVVKMRSVEFVEKIKKILLFNYWSVYSPRAMPVKNTIKANTDDGCGSALKQ